MMYTSVLLNVSPSWRQTLHNSHTRGHIGNAYFYYLYAFIIQVT